MKYKKEEILRVTFHEFLQKGYESPIIPCLQKKLGMSRGALYRHYKDKNDLFRAVTDHYFFNRIKRLFGDINPDVSTLELINYLYRKLLLLFVLYRKEGVTQASFSKYTNLLEQAKEHYPGFSNNLKKTKNYIEHAWQKAMKNSVDRTEVISSLNIELMSKLFADICFRDNKEYEVDAIFFHNMKNGLNQKTHILRYLHKLITP